jgi:hypothetical protein
MLIHDILGEFDRLMTTGNSFDNLHRCAQNGRPRTPPSCAGGRWRACSRDPERTPCMLRALSRPHFRNLNVGAQHASIDFDNSAELYARVRLGLSS